MPAMTARLPGERTAIRADHSSVIKWSYHTTQFREGTTHETNDNDQHRRICTTAMAGKYPAAKHRRHHPIHDAWRQPCWQIGPPHLRDRNGPEDRPACSNAFVAGFGQEIEEKEKGISTSRLPSGLRRKPVPRLFSKGFAISTGRVSGVKTSANRPSSKLTNSIISSGLFDKGRGIAEVGPIDIVAQVFAADGARCGFFDGNAVTYRNISAHPLTDGTWRNTKNFGQFALAPDNPGGFFDWIHTQSLVRLHFACQAHLNHIFTKSFRIAK